MQQKKDYPTDIESQHQILTLQKGQFFSKWVLEIKYQCVKEENVCQKLTLDGSKPWM